MRWDAQILSIAVDGGLTADTHAGREPGFWHFRDRRTPMAHATAIPAFLLTPTYPLPTSRDARALPRP